MPSAVTRVVAAIGAGRAGRLGPGQGRKAFRWVEKCTPVPELGPP